MKPAFIHPVRVAGAQSFVWKWRAAAGAGKSVETYIYFYDCLQDARKAGYECEFRPSDPTKSTPPTIKSPRPGASDVSERLV